MAYAACVAQCDSLNDEFRVRGWKGPEGPLLAANLGAYNRGHGPPPPPTAPTMPNSDESVLLAPWPNTATSLWGVCKRRLVVPSESTMDDENRVLAIIQSGDQDALARLLLDHGDWLLQRINGRLDSQPKTYFTADDVLQEVFITVFRKIDTYRSSEGTFSAWLTAVADNRLNSMLRDQRTLKRGGGHRRIDRAGHAEHKGESSLGQIVEQLADSPEDSPSRRAARQEAQRAVEQAITGLPTDQQEAIFRHYLKQQSLDSAAAQMQKTPGAVRGLLHRAKQSLRDALGRSSRWFSR